MYQRTGAPLHASYALPQLRAFYGKEENRPLAERIERWQTLSTISLHRWSGKPCVQMPISYSEASWTGMLDFRTCSWDDESLHLVETCPGVTQYVGYMSEGDEGYQDDIAILPPLADFDAPLPFLREGIPRKNDDGSDNAYWERWPEFRSHTLCQFLGIGDGAAANVGSKCGGGQQERGRQQRIAVTIGTSAAARVCLPLSTRSSSDQVRIPPGLFCYRVHRDTVLLGGALTDGGSVVEWARSLLNLQSPESFDACLARVTDMYDKRCGKRKRPTEDEVTMIPFLGGERSTGFRGGARACISGLTRDTTSNDVMYACLESVVLRLGRVLELISEACASRRTEGADESPENILVASGAALERNALWRRMLADCSNADVIVDGDSAEEGTSRGVAILLAESLQQTGLGAHHATFDGIVEQPLVVADETKCNAVARERWMTAASSQESLIAAIAPTW
jgi:gluconokinase